MSKPSAQIEDAQSKLRDTILAGLQEFTDETGLGCSGAHWQMAMAMDADGHTEAIQYWELRMDLVSGMS